jgi:molybdopterin converting factor small subunit
VSVTVRIPAQLRPLSGGAREAAVSGSTVGEVLKALDAAHPGFHDRLYDVRFLQGLDTSVADGQTLSIVPAVAGG